MREHDFPGPKLIVRHTGQRFSLAEGPVTIGRDDDNRIILADSRASRHHAVIEDRAGTFVVQDLRSANGTQVNGRRVAGTQVLRQGDAIRIGDTILDVQLAPGIDPGATIQAVRDAPPGVYTPGDFGTQTQQVGADWRQDSRGASRWPVIIAGLLVVGLIAAIAILAILLLGRDGAAPATVVLESPANGSQVSAGSEVNLEATASGEALTGLELLVDGVVAATASSPDAGGTDALRVQTPWIFETGTHIISARARTADGGVTEPVAASLLVVDEGVAQGSPTAAPPAITEEPGPVETTPEAPATVPSSPEAATEPATSTPSPTTEAPTGTPEGSEGPQPAGPGTITGFEEFGTWSRGAQANGTFAQSSEQVHSGTQAGRLDYSFSSGDNDFVVFLQTFRLEGRPNQLTAWVHGDGSGHYLNAWILDAAGETLQFTFGRVRHSGWQQMVAWLQPGDPWPAGNIDGPSNGTVDYPISLRALVLDDAPDSFSGSGTIYLDDLGYGEASAPPATATNTPAPAAPGPIIQFWADDTTISAGEATVLRWHVENVSAIYLNGDPVTGPDGSRRVRPSTPTTYRLRVVYPGGEEVLRVTITVN